MSAISGVSPSKLISASGTNSTLQVPKPCCLKGIQVFNINAAVRYLKLYDVATAPTIGTTIPVKVITIAGATTGAGAVIPLGDGVDFQNGLGVGLTTGVADNDTGSVAAGDIVVNFDCR